METPESINKAEELSESRYEIDYKGLLYTSIYSALSGITGGAVLQSIGTIGAESLPVAAGIVFLCQLIPKIIKELNDRHEIVEAKRDGYRAAILENDREELKTSKGTGAFWFVARVFSRIALF